MKTLVRLTLIWASLILITLMLTNASVAKIDAESIVGIWLFEATNELAIDSSNNGNDGEIVGAKRVEGKIGNGLEFDGTNYVKIPRSEQASCLFYGRVKNFYPCVLVHRVEHIYRKAFIYLSILDIHVLPPRKSGPTLLALVSI